MEHTRGGPLLGHVLAHEIAHLVEGIPRHSETGLMKASWTARDYSAMARGRLALAKEDVAIISGRLGLSSIRLSDESGAPAPN